VAVRVLVGDDELLWSGFVVMEGEDLRVGPCEVEIGFGFD
jgi:hypothetical protein